MPQFRKKPVVIEAMLVPKLNDRERCDELYHFLGNDAGWSINEDGSINIETLEGVMTANIGDWIIRGVKGEYYPCKPDIFAVTYEPVTGGK